MGVGRWGFEDLDDREYEEITGPRPARQPTEPQRPDPGRTPIRW